MDEREERFPSCQSDTSSRSEEFNFSLAHFVDRFSFFLFFFLGNNGHAQKSGKRADKNADVERGVRSRVCFFVFR